MKIKLFSLISILALYSCQPKNAEQATSNVQPVEKLVSWNPPAPGALVDKYEKRDESDNLNANYFRVSVFSTEESKNGHYNVKLEFGKNVNETSIDLPHWDHNITLKPVLQKGDSFYSCKLGFDIGDGKFKELYSITSENKNIKMKQIKGYYN